MRAPPRTPRRTSWNPDGTSLDLGGTLAEPHLRAVPPEPIWAETPKLSAVGEKTHFTKIISPTSRPVTGPDKYPAGQRKAVTQTTCKLEVLLKTSCFRKRSAGGVGARLLAGSGPDCWRGRGPTAGKVRARQHAQFPLRPGAEM